MQNWSHSKHILTVFNRLRYQELQNGLQPCLNELRQHCAETLVDSACQSLGLFTFCRLCVTLRLISINEEFLVPRHGI